MLLIYLGLGSSYLLGRKYKIFKTICGNGYTNLFSKIK